MAYLALIAGIMGGLAVLWFAAGSSRAPRRRSGAAPASFRSSQNTAAKAATQLTPTPPMKAPAPVLDGAAEAIKPPPIEIVTLRLLDDTLLEPDVALRLAGLADSLPRPRSVMLQLAQAGDDPAELARIVATDPATAALLLRTVNSAQFSLRSEITSIQHAITYLGANLVRDVAIRHAMTVPAAGRNLTTERIYQGLWRNSYLASGIALALAQRLRLPAPAATSTQALLFMLGDIALVSHYPQIADLYNADLDLAVLVAGTQERLGFNSAMVGAHLAQVWQLPAGLRVALRKSLMPLVSGPDTLDPETAPGLVVSYFSNRLAQALWRQVDFDLVDAMQALRERPEAYYLPQHLAAVGLQDALSALTEPAVERRLASLVKGLSAPR